MHISAGEATRPWWKSRLLFLAAASLGFIYLFVRLGAEVTERETNTFDGAVRDWVFAHRPGPVVILFGAITQLGSVIGLTVASGLVVWVLLRRGARGRPLMVATLPFLLSLIVNLLKAEYRIARPPAGLAAALSFSFPSGHTSASTAVFVVIGYVLARERVAPRLGLALAIVVPIAVGISRIYLDVHWASDVVGGWMIGAAYAAGVCALYERAHQRGQHKSRSSEL